MPKKKTSAAVTNADDTSLNKYISSTGFCSRREADHYILQGRVTINENVAVPGNRVAAGDVVEIDGEPIARRVKTVYLAFHKPVGVTSTTDPKEKTNIISYIGFPQRIFPAGRLDKESEGLIFLTNDGDIVNKILRAGNAHEKEYIVTIDKPMDADFVKLMSAGVRILGTTTEPCKVVAEGKSVFRITLIQGLNRQIRRMCSALGYEVVKLKRVRIMGVHIGSLPVGHWRYLTPEEITRLQTAIAGSVKTATPPKPKPAAALPEKPRDTTAPKKSAAPAKKNTPAQDEPPKKSSKKRSYKDFRQAAKAKYK